MNNGKGCVTPKQKEKFDRREATKEAKHSIYDEMEFRLVDKANYVLAIFDANLVEKHKSDCTMI